MASSAGGAGGRQIALVLLTLGAACAEVEWADSQVLTDTWKAVSGGDFNTLLALTVSAKEGFAAQRSAVRRGRTARPEPATARARARRAPPPGLTGARAHPPPHARPRLPLGRARAHVVGVRV